MMSKTTPLILLGILVAIVSSCGGGSSKPEKPPLPKLKSVIEFTTPQVHHTLTVTDKYPKRIAGIQISHTGKDGDVSYSFADPSGAIRANPIRGTMRPGQTHSINVEAIGLSFATITLTLVCIYADHTSTDQLDVPFELITNGGRFLGEPVKDLTTITEPTKLRHMLTPSTKFPLNLDFLELSLSKDAIIPARFEVTDPLGNLLSRPGSGKLEPGAGKQRVDFDAMRNQFGLTRMNLSVRYDVVGKTEEYRRAWDIRNASPPNLEALRSANVFTANNSVTATRFWPGLDLAPIGVVILHPMGAPRNKVPALLFTEIGLVGSLNVDLTSAQLGKAFWQNKTTRGSTTGEAFFPPGQGRNGFTIHANQETDMKAGNYLVFHVTMERTIPIVDPDKKNEHLYYFAIDSDLKTANNWSPPPTLPNDPHADTDRWYEIGYNDPTARGTWTFHVHQLNSEKTPIEVASGARAIISDNAIVLLIPTSEFGPVKPKWRAASFVHQGKFGNDPPYPWSGDAMPAVGMALLSVR